MFCIGVSEQAVLGENSGHRRGGLHRRRGLTALLARGDSVIGVDNLSSYYDVVLKQARLLTLAPHKDFTFLQADIADKSVIGTLAGTGIGAIIHLAASPVFATAWKIPSPMSPPT